VVNYIRGNLLTSDSDVIIHGCNCFGTMGAGIAAQVKKTYPEAYKTDLATTKGDRFKLGTFSFAPVSKSGIQPKLIFNLYSQYRWGPDEHGNPLVDYRAITKGSALIRDLLAKESATCLDKDFDSLKISYPKIGAGLAGGNWKIIENLLNQVWQNHPIYVYVL
jgi:O-acetyl-ADP-ribose deacetylase (regulator of RNase III)